MRSKLLNNKITEHDNTHLCLDSNYLIQIKKPRKHRKAKKLFSKRKCRECRPTQTSIEQNNDHTRMMRKIRFCSSFKLQFSKK